MVEQSIYWIGLIHLAGYMVVGMLWLADKLIDRTIKSLGLYREFLEFSFERIKARRKKKDLPA